MAVTLTDQVHLFQHSAGGADGTEEAAGLHTHHAFDMVRALNNLGTYCNPKTVYLQGCTAPGVSDAGYNVIGTGTVRSSTLVGGPGTSREYFVAQGLTVAPMGAKRLLWTAGIRPVLGGGDESLTLTAATLYVASQHYSGAVAPSAFEASNLSLGYRSHSPATFSSSVYKLVDDATTGIVQPYPANAKTDGAGNHLVNLIFTVTGTCTDGANPLYALIAVEDFTAWWVWE